MSTAPIAGPARPAPGVAPTRSHLRLVEHLHDWALRAVDHDEGLMVREFECLTCHDVTYR